MTISRIAGAKLLFFFDIYKFLSNNQSGICILQAKRTVNVISKSKLREEVLKNKGKHIE